MRESPLKNAQWRTYTEADGLPSNVLEHVAEDAQGNLWIAARGGLSLFDGELIQTLNELDGLPKDIHSLWRADDGGVGYANPSHLGT